MTKNKSAISDDEITHEEIIGRVKNRFKELKEKQWDWESFYNGWFEGRADLKFNPPNLNRKK